jgi:hypothetical protein
VFFFNDEGGILGAFCLYIAKKNWRTGDQANGQPKMGKM